MWQPANRLARQIWHSIASPGRQIGLIALISVVGLAGCQSRPAPTHTPMAYTATSPPVSATSVPTTLPAILPVGLDTPHRAAFRLVNGLDQSPIDIYLERTRIGAALAYGRSTPLTAFAPGSYTLHVFHAGDAPIDTNAKLSQSITLPDGLSGLIVFSGTSDKPTATLLANDLSPIPAGKIRLSVAAFGNAAAFPITAYADQQQIATLNTPGTLAKSVLQPATLQAVTFDPQGGGSINSPGGFSERLAYLVVLLPSADVAAHGKVIVVGDDSERIAQVRIINASLDLAAANVQLGDQIVATALGTGKATGWQAIPAGSNYSLSVSGLVAVPTLTATARPTVRATRSGADVTAAAQPTTAPNTPNTPAAASRLSVAIDLPPDARLDVIVYGPAAALQIQSLTEDFSPIESGQARLEVFNAAPGTNGILPFTEGSQLSGFSGADYGQSSGPGLVSAQPLALQFRTTNAAGTVQAVEFKPPFTYKAGTAYLYVVTGSPTKTPPIILDTPITVNPPAVPGATTTPNGRLQFRLLNAMSDGTGVSVALNGQMIFDNIPAGQATAYQSIGSQFATWTLTDAGPAHTPLAKTDFTQIGHGTVTLLALGTAHAARFYQSIDTIPAGVTDALLDVIHAAPNALLLRIEAQSVFATAQPGATPSEPLVEPTLAPATQAATESAVVATVPGALTATPFDLTAPANPTAALLLPPTPIQYSALVADRLEYSSVSPLRVMPSGTYTLIVRDNSTGMPLGQLSTITIVPGQRYDVLLLPGDTNGTLKMVVVTSAIPTLVTPP
ncbi:MAG: DUF4397 domain-containing protein [Aggregatilineales bacterium]